MLGYGEFYYFVSRFNLWKPFGKTIEINLGFEDKKSFSNFLIPWHLYEDKSWAGGWGWGRFIGPQGRACTWTCRGAWKGRGELEWCGPVILKIFQLWNPFFKGTIHKSLIVRQIKTMLLCLKQIRKPWVLLIKVNFEHTVSLCHWLEDETNWVFHSPAM